MTYPNVFIGYAEYLAKTKQDYVLAEKVLDTYLEYFPVEKIPFPVWRSYQEEYQIAEIYNLCGNTEKLNKYVDFALKTLEHKMNNPKV
jgi:hypothetical protein